MQADLQTLERPGVLGHVRLDGIVVLEVVFDDASMQSAIDEIHGPGVVFVASALC